MKNTLRFAHRALLLAVALTTATLTGCQTTSREALFQVGDIKVERKTSTGGLKQLLTGEPQQQTRTTLKVGEKKVEVREQGRGLGEILFGGDRKPRAITVERKTSTGGLGQLLTGEPQKQTRTTLKVDGKKKIEVREQGPSFEDLLFGGRRN